MHRIINLVWKLGNWKDNAPAAPAGYARSRLHFILAMSYATAACEIGGRRPVTRNQSPPCVGG